MKIFNWLHTLDGFGTLCAHEVVLIDDIGHEGPRLAGATAVEDLTQLWPLQLLAYAFDNDVTRIPNTN